MVEMALLVLSSPFWSVEKIRSRFKIDLELIDLAKERLKTQKPKLLLTTHFGLMEAITFAPILFKEAFPEVGVIYRPLNNKDLEHWVKQTRQRFGIELLSRKNGMNRAKSILRKNGIVCVLFDQNAGVGGPVSLFFDRLAYCSELAGIFAENFNPDIIMIYIKRTGFWQGTLKAQMLDVPNNKSCVTIHSNQWLEHKMKEDEILCASWLWLHKRWDLKQKARERLQAFTPRKSYLEETLKIKNYKECPKTVKIFIRLSNWLGDVVMALPLIRAIKESRPDATLVLIGKESFRPFLTKINLVDTFISLPDKGGLRYFKAFRQLKTAYPEVHIQFTNSIRSDIEAFCIGAPHRFGIQRPGKRRPLLTHTWKKPKTLDEASIHQTQLWLKYLQHFGLKESIDLSPLSIDIEAKHCAHKHTIGLICGTENNPEKRWPVKKWRKLIRRVKEHYSDFEILLFGTPTDRTITQEVAKGFLEVKDIAGKTSLIDFIAYLKSCDVVVCNDTGGMHLANAIGVPVIGVFGPTNPVRTGPVYSGKSIIIQPEGCPKTGGKDIVEVKTDAVFKHLHTFLN